MTVSKLLRIPTHVKRANVSVEERDPAAERDPDIVDMSQTPDDVNPDDAGTAAAASSEATSQDGDVTGTADATGTDTDAGVASTEATGDVATGAEPDAAAGADDTAASADQTQTDNSDAAGGDDATSAAADVGATTSAEATPPADDSTVDSGSAAANADLDTQGDITPPDDVQTTEPEVTTDAATDLGASDVTDVASTDGGDLSATTDTSSADTTDLGDASTGTDTGAAEPEVAPVENPAEDIPDEALTSAWVQGVAVDNQNDVNDVKDGEEELDAYQHNEDELHDVATSLEELRNCCVPVAVVTHTETEDVSTPVQTEIVADISDKAIDLLTSSSNQALSRLGSQLDLPATTESAGTPAERLQITMEAIDGKLKQIWEAIKKMAVAAWEAFVGFVKGIFDKAQRIRNQVSGLRKFVAQFKGATPEATEFENNAVWAGCCVELPGDKNEFDVAKVSPQFETYLSAAKPYLLNASKALAPGLNLVFDRIAAIDPEKGETRQAMWEAFANLMGRYSKSVVMVTKMVGGETKLDDSELNVFSFKKGLQPIYSNAGLGGGFLAVDIMDPNVNVDIAAPAFWNHASSRYVRGRVEVPEGAKVPTLTADQMETMLDQIDEAMETVLEYRPTFKAFEQQLAKGQQATSKLANKIEGNSEANIAIFASMKLVPKLTGFNQAIINGLYVQSSAMLQYIVASTKQYSANDAAVESTAQSVADEGAAKLPAPAAA